MASHTPGAPIFAPAAELPDWALRALDLASPRLHLCRRHSAGHRGSLHHTAPGSAASGNLR